jgi:hypothetical protein|tara:strand:- start:6390 stop:6752 length:363 start_codon:yes stop_codon:yes gene_type:complete
MSTKNGKGKRGQNVTNLPKAKAPSVAKKMAGVFKVPETAAVQIRQAWQQARQAQVDANNLSVGVVLGMAVDVEKYKPIFNDDYSEFTLEERGEPSRDEQPEEPRDEKVEDEQRETANAES